MFPDFAISNVTDVGSVDAKALGYFGALYALRAQGTNFLDLILSEFGIRTRFAAWVPTLHYLVRHVGRIVAKKEVVRIAAWGVVAFMKAIKAIGNWPVMQFPRNAVSKKYCSLRSTCLYNAIAARIRTPLPQPTLIECAWGKVFPEANRERRIQSSMTRSIAPRLAFDDAATMKVSLGYIRLLPTSTVAITVRDLLFRHKKFSYRQTVGALAEGALPANRRKESISDLSPTVKR